MVERGNCSSGVRRGVGRGTEPRRSSTLGVFSSGVDDRHRRVAVISVLGAGVAQSVVCGARCPA